MGPFLETLQGLKVIMMLIIILQYSVTVPVKVLGPPLERYTVISATAYP